MHICLINPPSPFQIRQDVFPPLGLFYIAEYAREVGDVTVVDVGLGDKIPNADVYGITCNITQVDWVKENAPKLRNHGYMVIGGPYATTCPGELSTIADCVVQGDAEADVATIFREQPRGVIQSQSWKYEELRFPARDLGRVFRYHYYLNNKRATSMITSRGCPMDCAFCCQVQDFEKIKIRTAAHIAKEVDHILNLGFEAIMFYDDIFHLNRKRTREICEELKMRNVIWKCFCRTNNMSEEILEWMAEAGCVEISYGVESGSQKILDIISKRTRVEQNLRIIQATNALGIHSRVFIIVGLPGESWDTIEETRRFLQVAKPASCGIGIYMPYPGSAIWNHPELYPIIFHLNEGELRDFWYRGKPGSYKSFVSTPYMSRDEIVKAHEMLSTEFEKLDQYLKNHGEDPCCKKSFPK